MDETEDKIRIATAYHEAGHAVAGCVTGRIPLFVSIAPEPGGFVGRTQFDDIPPDYAKRHFDQSSAKKEYTKMRVLVELAGSAALDIYDPTRVHDISDEYDDVIVRQMIDELAWWEEPNLYFEEARRDVTDLLKEHWQKLSPRP